MMTQENIKVSRANISILEIVKDTLRSQRQGTVAFDPVISQCARGLKDQD